MAINNFYNTTAIIETYTTITDDYGQEVKTWSVSTYVVGAKQGRSGSESVINTQERISKNERFYCDVININPFDRLVFSTKAYTFIGDSTSTTALTSTSSGSMYFATDAFSTYTQYDYIINQDSTYIVNDVTRNNILYINDRLRNRHLQIDLDLDYENRS